jgi:nitroreductase
LVAVRIEHTAVEHLRADRRAAGRAQDVRRRARCPRRPLGRTAVRDVPARAEVPVRGARSAFGKERYSSLGIAREDWEARQRAAIANWNCFGAPAALFCYIDRDLGRPQWADVGMYLQTVMLLLRAEGLHSCPQMAWSQVRETVAEVLSPSDGLILFCGMSIGYEDPTVSYARTGRAPLDETVTFVGG